MLRQINVTSLGGTGVGGEIPGSHLSSGGMAALFTAQPLGLETCLCLENIDGFKGPGEGLSEC